MNKNIGIVLGVIVIAGIGYFAISRGTIDTKSVEGEKTNNLSESVGGEVTNNMPVPGSSVPEMVVEKEQNTTTTSTGSYEAYSPTKLAMAESGDVVLFFYASWCPSCRGLNSDIEKNVGTIPTGVTILKTDYDKEVALKKKYGVTTQHTLVQVDKNGNLIKKWSGGAKLENLLSQIQ